MFLLLSLSKIFLNIKFTLSWWAFTFPLCAFSIVSSDLYISYSNSMLYKALGIIGLICAFFAVLVIFVKTFIAMKDGEVFVVE